jgi:heat shock protein HslJ
MATTNNRKTGISILMGSMLVLGICLLSAGCLSESSDSDAGALKGTEWQLKSYDNGAAGAVSVIGGSTITLIFGEDGRIAGSAGVNTYFASYEANGYTLSFGDVGTTRMAGPAPLMAQESMYLKLLSETATFSVEKGELKLLNADGTVLLTFEKIPPVTAESLKGSDWVLRSYNDNAAIVSVITGTEITLSFDEKGGVAGSAGVNRYFASYEAKGNALTFGEAGTTLMAGPADAMQQEATFLKLLGETATFSGAGDELKLLNADGTVILVFARVVPAASESLTGTTWILDSYHENEAVVSVITGTEISLSLDKDGKISGLAGCNNYFGAYETDGAALSFKQVGATLMYCDEPEGLMAQETTYLSLLETAASYGITEDQLTVKNASGAVILTFTAAA